MEISFENIHITKPITNVDIYVLGLSIKNIYYSTLVGMKSFSHFTSFNEDDLKIDMRELLSNTKINKVNLNTWNDIGIKNISSMASMFLNSTAEEITFGKLDTSKVTNMSRMLDLCKNLKHVDISSLDTSKVEEMYELFRDCTSLDFDEITLDVSSAINLFDMFTGSCIRKAYLKNPSDIIVKMYNRFDKKEFEYYFNSNNTTEIELI